MRCMNREGAKNAKKGSGRVHWTSPLSFVSFAPSRFNVEGDR